MKFKVRYYDLASDNPKDKKIEDEDNPKDKKIEDEDNPKATKAKAYTQWYPQENYKKGFLP